MTTDRDGDLSAWYASTALHWPENVKNLAAKQEVAERIAGRVTDGALIGIGSGSATYMALWSIGQRVQRESLSIRIATTSYETQAAAVTLGLSTVPLGSVQPDWGVDGADELDPHGRLLKGRGGAMFREKVLWSTCKHMYLAIDPSKHVERLGQGFPIPIEVDRAAVDLVGRALDLHGSTRWGLRLAGSSKDGPVITESGNLVIDAWFDDIAHGLSAQLKLLTGVIETGLFEGYGFEVV
ncbi:MAG TPA: ribose 5-phosphate isomerase A [Solirubrobacteraceae bacterium]|nr:ribose 5-phosphate isomerase A [Solirubrobacteraceae bacterium]